MSDDMSRNSASDDATSPDAERLDPRIVAALRAVTPADATTREQHIAAALDEVRDWSNFGGERRMAGTSGPRWWMSVAAVSVALLAGGAFIGRASVENTPVAMRNNAPTTSVVKGDTTTPCAEQLGTATYVGTFTVAGQERIIAADDVNVYFYLASDCSLIGSIAQL